MTDRERHRQTDTDRPREKERGSSMVVVRKPNVVYTPYTSFLIRNKTI